MIDPNIILETPVYNINLTLLLSVITVSLATMGTIVAIFKKKPREDEKPGGSPFCKQAQADLERIENAVKASAAKLENTTKENIEKQEKLRELCNDLGKEVVVLKNESKNNTKNVDEMKQSIQVVATKLDDLLKQLMDWMAD